MSARHRQSPQRLWLDYKRLTAYLFRMTKLLGKPAESDVSADRGTTTGMPRWVKVFGIISIVLLVLFVLVHVLGGGFRGHGG